MRQDIDADAHVYLVGDGEPEAVRKKNAGEVISILGETMDAVNEYCEKYGCAGRIEKGRKAV